MYVLFVEIDIVNPQEFIICCRTFSGKNVTSKIEPLEPVTEKDRQLIQLLIEQPILTNAQIARKLGISRQAISERRKRLEREGIIQLHIFWNIVPKLRLTKHFDIIVGDARDKEVEELTEYLVSNWKASLVWLSGQNIVSGIILTERENLFRKIIRDEFSFVRDIKLQPVRFKKFLGQRIRAEPRNSQNLDEIAKKEAIKLSTKKSIDVILYSTNSQKNSINLVALKNRRFHLHTSITSTDKIFENAYVHIMYGTYEILKEMIHSKRKRNLTRNLKIIFARNNIEERRIRRLLRLAHHI